MHYAYILKSLKDGKYYYGRTSDLENRLKYHNSGKARSTKSRRPLVLHYYEEFPTKTEAIHKEIYFKSIEGRNWLKSKAII
jgi:putative endonuclease